MALLRALTRAARTIAVHVEPVLRTEGLTLDQWLVIDALASARGLAMTDLGAATLVTGPTLTRVVDRLILTAVAYREVDATDRRRVRVYLGPRGHATHRRVGAKLAELEEALLQQMETPDVLLAALDDLVEQAHASEPEPAAAMPPLVAAGRRGGAGAPGS
ncbi:MarR family winged helix-turn-helix transcriptional regulator [Pendulispora albinea]|uniref:MarR family transcriptional regulator n=1 Tax=Pendulispora albinea TaxID=2741071 RepID=A0ABZ2LZW3_9BACT